MVVLLQFGWSLIMELLFTTIIIIIFFYIPKVGAGEVCCVMPIQ